MSIILKLEIIIVGNGNNSRDWLFEFMNSFDAASRMPQLPYIFFKLKTINVGTWK